MAVDALAAARRLATPEAPVVSPVAAVSDPRDHNIQVEDYCALDGKHFSGTLHSRVPTRDEQDAIGRIAARIAGTKWEWLPDEAQERIMATAIVAIQIREPPQWFSEHVADDDELLLAVAGECVAHSRRFRRGRREIGDSTEGAPRISIAATDAGADAV